MMHDTRGSLRKNVLFGNRRPAVYRRLTIDRTALSFITDIVYDGFTP